MLSNWNFSEMKKAKRKIFIQICLAFFVIKFREMTLTRQYRYGVFSPFTLSFLSLKFFSLKSLIYKVVFREKSI